MILLYTNALLVLINNNPNTCAFNRLTAARGVRALGASFSWVFVWGYLPRDDNINEVCSCNGRLSTGAKLLFNAWFCWGLVLGPYARAIRISWMRLASWQRHSSIGWLHGSSVRLLLLLLRETCSSPSWNRGGHIVVPFVFALLHLAHVHLWSRGCSIHQSSQSISCSAVARATLGCCCRCCWWPNVERKRLYEKEWDITRSIGSAKGCGLYHLYDRSGIQTELGIPDTQ